jgi:hypothetical protein
LDELSHGTREWMGFLRDIDDTFRCNDAGFHEELMTRIYRSAQTGSPSKIQAEGKGFVPGSAGVGNIQCSVASMQYQ